MAKKLCVYRTNLKSTHRDGFETIFIFLISFLCQVAGSAQLKFFWSTNQQNRNYHRIMYSIV